MLVISCCAINRLSVSCPVFCVVEHLVTKTVEKQKKTFKTSEIFSLWLVFNCLWLLWWHCSCQTVGRPGVAAGLGVALAGGTCTPWVALSSRLCEQLQGTAGLLQARMCVPVFLHCHESHSAFPWSWLEVLSLAHCQVLQVWEENLVPGENLFIKWGIFVSPLRGSLWLNVKVHDGWLSFLMDGLTGMQASCISQSEIPKCHYKVVGTPVAEKDCIGQ